MHPPSAIFRITLQAICATALILATPFRALPEFYRYTDDQGRSVYVDDISKVPSPYLDQVRSYAEPHDGLPAAERRRQQEAENRRTLQSEQERAIRFQRLMEIRRQENAAHLARKRRQQMETPIRIFHNQVLVPVRIGYGTQVATVQLVLDTGASITAIHRDVAEQLQIRDLKSAQAQVASGTVIDAHVGRVDFIEVGPKRVTDLETGILSFTGSGATHSGLLGMNFLGRFQYTIDLKNRVIRWAD